MRAELLEAIWRGGDFAIRLWAALIWVVLALHPSWGMVVAVALLNGYALAVNRARMTWSGHKPSCIVDSQFRRARTALGEGRPE